MANKLPSAARRNAVGQSGEDYLEAVLVLGRGGDSVRVTELARRLGVSKPSVVNALAALETRGLLRHERYGGVELTARGRRVAREVDRRHRLLRGFLEDVLGVRSRTAEQDACRLEHDLSPETVRRLVRFVGKQGRPAARSVRPRGRKRAGHETAV